jgi:hypothetical protein
MYDPHRLQFKKMATSSLPLKKLSNHSVLPPPKNFRLEQENNAKMNLYRFHLRPPEETVTLPTPEPLALAGAVVVVAEPSSDTGITESDPESVPKPEPEPVAPVTEPSITTVPVARASTPVVVEPPIIVPEPLSEPQPQPTQPTRVKDTESKPSVSPIVPKVSQSSQPTSSNNTTHEQEGATVKYRLEKVKDELTGQYRFKLRKVGFLEESATTAPTPTTPTTPTTPPVNTNSTSVLAMIPTAPPTAIPTAPISTKTSQRFRLEKSNDGGISKYALKDLSEERLLSPPPPPSSPRPERDHDFAEESVNIHDLYTPSSNAIQHLSLHRKVVLQHIERNGGVFLLGDEPVGQHFTMRDVLQNSNFLYSTHVLENITIKLITDNFDKAVLCKLSFYYLEPDGKDLIPLHTIDLGSLEAGSVARYLTRSINLSTPRKGCVLVSVLDITPEVGLILPRKGKMVLEYSVLATKKMGMQERTIQWSKIEHTPMRPI